jgi:hypothetical protein
MQTYLRRGIHLGVPYYDDGNLKVTETVTKTSSQDWTAYNDARWNEYRLFMELLADLCAAIEEPKQGMSRASKPFSDMVYACELKVYSGFTLRRFESMMEVAQERGHIDETCSYATVCTYMIKDEMVDLLHDLIACSSSPLTVLESDFTVDSSGFSTSRFERYFDYKYVEEKKYRMWVKANVCSGVQSNIITAVSLTEWKAGDSPEFGALVKLTAEVFGVEEVSADKAYSSRENHTIVDELGGEAYIPFTENATGAAKRSTEWKRMYHTFQMEEDEFRQHYKRINAETVPYAENEVGDSVNAKNGQSQFNEMLLKVLCQNTVVVIYEMQESDIDPAFQSETLENSSALT